MPCTPSRPAGRSFTPGGSPIIGHPSLAIASETIHEICDIPIEIYTHAPEADIPAIVHTALDSGNDTIIGGGAACLYAESLHVNNFNSLTDRETLYRAVVDAVQRVQLHRQEEIRLRTLRPSWMSPARD